MDALKVIIFDSHFSYDIIYKNILKRRSIQYLKNVNSIDELNTLQSEFETIDLLIINHQSDGLNLVNIKDSIKSIKNKTIAIILFTSIYNVNIHHYLYNLGIDYIIHKNNINVEFDLVMNLVLNQYPIESNLIKTDYQRNLKLKSDIKTLLNNINLPLKLAGYSYLALAIELVYLNQNLGYASSKQLYPLIAKTFDTNPNRVERAIRNVLKKITNPHCEYYQLSNMAFVFKSIENLKRPNVD